jgi:hypothetical protein
MPLKSGVAGYTQKAPTPADPGAPRTDRTQNGLKRAGRRRPPAFPLRLSPTCKAANLPCGERAASDVGADVDLSRESASLVAIWQVRDGDQTLKVGRETAGDTGLGVYQPHSPARAIPGGEVDRQTKVTRLARSVPYDDSWRFPHNLDAHLDLFDAAARQRRACAAWNGVWRFEP